MLKISSITRILKEMVNIIPVASGKGGVGKSALSANLSILLAQSGKKTVLVDLDLGGANLHTLLGLKNNHTGLGNFIYRQFTTLEPLLQDTGIENLYFIAGDCLFPGTANLGFFIKKRLIKELHLLDADYVILDLGAGAAFNTLDFFLITYNSLLVTTPEITSILNAYSFLKSAAYRFFTCQFKAKSEERMAIQRYIENSTEGIESSFEGLVKSVCAEFPETGERAVRELSKYRPQVILNQGNSVQDLEMARRLRSLTFSKMGISIDFVGFIPKDEALPLSVAMRKPLVLTSPQSAFARQLKAAVERIQQHSYSYNNAMFEYEELPMNSTGGDADLRLLSEEFIQ